MNRGRHGRERELQPSQSFPTTPRPPALRLRAVPLSSGGTVSVSRMSHVPEENADEERVG